MYMCSYMVGVFSGGIQTFYGLAPYPLFSLPFPIPIPGSSLQAESHC